MMQQDRYARRVDIWIRPAAGALMLASTLAAGACSTDDPIAFDPTTPGNNGGGNDGGGNNGGGNGGGNNGGGVDGPVNPANGYDLQVSTYFGGPEDEEIRQAAVRDDGALVFGLNALDAMLPTTAGALQSMAAGGESDTYIAVLSPGGTDILAATYFGGTGKEGAPLGLAIDENGDVVLAAATNSVDLMITEGAYRRMIHSPGGDDAYVASLSSDLTMLLWSTYLGPAVPSGGLTIDPAGNLLVAGEAQVGFPATENAFQRDLKGSVDAFVTQLAADGVGAKLATLIGGSGTGNAVEAATGGARADGDGNIYLAGVTVATDFPTTANAPFAQPPAGTGAQAFISKLSANGELTYSTYLGGSNGASVSHPILLLDDRSVVVAGVTASPDLPVTENAFQPLFAGNTDGFVARLSPDGSRFEVVTYFGGSGTELQMGSPARDPDGHIVIAGATDSTDLPTTTFALQPSYGGGASDGFIAVLSADATQVLYASYFGGTGDDAITSVAVDAEGGIHVVGYTTSTDLSVTSNALQTSPGGGVDGFVLALEPRAMQPNLPPDARFSLAANALAVWVDAASSADPDPEDKLSYTWDFGDGGSATGVTASHTYSSTGAYTIALVLDDGRGAVVTSTQTISVAAAPAAPIDGDPSTPSLDDQQTGWPWVAVGISKFFKVYVPSSATTLDVQLGGPPCDSATCSVDADLYVRYGARPTDTDYDCRPMQMGNAEACNLAAPRAGWWYIRVVATQGSGPVQVTPSHDGAFTTEGNRPPAASIALTQTNPSVYLDASQSTDQDGDPLIYRWDFGDGTTARGAGIAHTYDATGTYTIVLEVEDGRGGLSRTLETVTITPPVDGDLSTQNLTSGATDFVWVPNNGESHRKIHVPEGTPQLTVTISGPTCTPADCTFDTDLYVRHDARADDAVFDCRPMLVSNEEVCTIDQPAGGWWYVRLKSRLGTGTVRVTAIR